MTTWTDKRERRAIRAHLRQCRFCRALRAYGERRRDHDLLAASDHLAAEHGRADAERRDLDYTIVQAARGPGGRDPGARGVA